jgi:hypothetical protein
MRKIGILAFSMVGLLLFSRQGQATPTSQNCTVTNVSWYTGGDGKRLYVNCSVGGNFVANLAGSGTSTCEMATNGAVDIDSIKIWQSIAVSAKLSGKPITIWFGNSSDCGGNHIVYSIDFNG